MRICYLGTRYAQGLCSTIMILPTWHPPSFQYWVSLCQVEGSWALSAVVDYSYILGLHNNLLQQPSVTSNPKIYFVSFHLCEVRSSWWMVRTFLEGLSTAWTKECSPSIESLPRDETFLSDSTGHVIGFHPTGVTLGIKICSYARVTPVGMSISHPHVQTPFPYHADGLRFNRRNDSRDKVGQEI